MLEFVYFSKKYLKDWNTELYGRQVKMAECLLNVWRQIDVQNRGKITWEEFNSKIIETSLSLKSLANNAGIQTPTFRQFSVTLNPSKHESPIQKIIHLTRKNKMAYFREQSTTIQFFQTQAQSQSSQQSLTRPIILPQQELKVETMIKVKEKSESKSMSLQKHSKASSMIKKEVKVSSYKNTVLDTIYLEEQKYDMLIASCSDKYIRGYNVTNIVPVVGSQPQNQDEMMVHQFPVEIYTMAWDPVNEVLYGTGKYATIYQWLVKTDSQREMFDSRGHEGMISVMLMMPKLQLLATGGYDGRLLLWDTVGQCAKCKYDEHTRAISSITFHQQLILLFTSAFDHKICVWNPYISSLIHKIDSTLNVVQLQVIPNTNFLLSLDCGGNVKVKEVNRFTQVAAFSIFRSEEEGEQLNTNRISSTQKEKEITINMCSKKDGIIKYYFATDKIVGYEYVEAEKATTNHNHGIFPQINYLSNNFKLLTPIKNHILVWNLLTGRNEQTFYDMTENEITAIQIVQQLGFFIVGDVDGNVIQRRIINGFFIKNILKMKTPVNNLKFTQLEKSQKEKSTHKTYYLFSTTQQGEITVLKYHSKGQFQLYRHFSLKNDFSIANGNISAIQYFVQKHVLILKLATNDIVTIDIEKRTLLTKIQFGEKSIRRMNIISGLENDYFLTIFTASSQFTAFYLPPHNKKFKPSCFFTTENSDKIECSTYGIKSQTFFVSTQSNELHSFQLDKKLLTGQNQTFVLRTKWKIQVSKRVVDMLLIENEQIIILLNQSEEFTFLSTSNGEVICNLQQQSKNQLTNKQPIQPLFYMRVKTNEIYFPQDQKISKLNQDELQSQKIHKIIDPSFYINYLSNKNINNFSKVSNPSWTLNLDVNLPAKKRIQQIQLVQEKIKNCEKTFEKKGPAQMEKTLEIAMQLQKKWEKEKQKDQLTQTNDLVKNINSLQRRSTSKFDIKAFDTMMKKNSRGSSLSSLWIQKQGTKKNSGFSVHAERIPHIGQNKGQLINSRIQKFNQIQKLDLTKLQKDPLYRLGLALKSVNTTDKKAENFMQLARKKEEVRLPKISSQKMKL